MTEAERKAIDTRALEIAGRALVLIERHERDCERQRIEDRRLADDFRDEVRAAFKALYLRHWMAAGSLIGAFATLWARAQGWL